MSFRYKTIIGIAIIEAILLVILVWNALHFLHSSSEEELVTRARSTVQLISTMTQDAVLSTDLARLESFVQKVLESSDLVYVKIYREGKLFAQGGNSEALAKPFQPDETFNEVDDGIFDTYVDIKEAGYNFGRIEIGIATTKLAHIFSKAQRKISIIAIIELVLSALFSFILGTYLVARLKKLGDASAHLAAGNFGYQVEVSGNDEIAITANAFNKMSKQIKNYLFEIQQVNKNLSQEVDKRSRAEKAVKRTNAELENKIEELARNIAITEKLSQKNAIMEERSRLARELHDSVTQSLYSQSLFAETAKMLCDQGDFEKAHEHLLELSKSILETIKEMRLLVYNLRPTILKEEGLLRAIKKRLDSVETRSDILGNVQLKGEENLSEQEEETIYRIIMEALNNTLKHSKATTVNINIVVESDWAQIV